MVYDPDRFEYSSVCGTVEYEDTRYRQMLDCGSVFPWIRRPCERGGKAPLRGRCVWHSKTVSTPTYCASVALDKLHHGTSYLSTKIKIFHDHQQITIASRIKYARYGNWDVSRSIRICYTEAKIRNRGSDYPCESMPSAGCQQRCISRPHALAERMPE